VGPEQLAPFDPDGRLFLNVNTPDDLDRAVRFLARTDQHAGL
jgi:GTP:adenosylcobinamide-phosphate guanylyltransferase